MKNLIASAFFSVFLLNSLFSQVSIKDSSLTIPMFYVAYSYQFPGGDMKERYGSNSTIGPGFQVKTGSNWIYGAEANFIFGNNAKACADSSAGIIPSN